MVNPVEPAGPSNRLNVVPRNISPQQPTRRPATAVKKDADKAKAEWTEASYWAQLYRKKMQAGQPPADTYWPIKLKPSFPWGYSVVIPSANRRDFEIPFQLYQPPARTPDGFGLPLVVKQLGDVNVPSSALTQSTLPEVLALLKEQTVISCALHVTATYVTVAYLAEMSYYDLFAGEAVLRKSLHQIRCATILPQDLDACLARLRWVV